MKALSIRQPWAWAILHGGKDVENRSWRTQHRGSLLIHAGAREDPDARGQLLAIGLEVPDTLPLGGIVGVVDVVDCVRGHESPWAINGEWHWLLARPRVVPFRALPGRLKLFEA